MRMDKAATERGPQGLFHRNAGWRSWRAPLRRAPRRVLAARGRRRAGDTRSIARSWSS